MSYTVADFRRDYAKEHFKDLTPQERREVLQDLAPQERREVLQDLAPEERLAGLSAQEIATYLKKLQSERPPRKGKPRRRR